MKLYDKLASNLLRRYLKRKLGVDIDISVENLTILGSVKNGDVVGDKLFVEAKVGAFIPADELDKIIEERWI